MVRAGLNLATERRARVVVLQVKSDNQGARTLYESLGFQTLSTRTTWVRPPGPLPPTGEVVGRVRRRHPADWVAQWTLAERTHPEGLFWPYPLNAAYFRPSGLPAGIDWEGKRHWVWQEAEDIHASLTAQPRAEERGWRLALLVDVRARGRAEAALLTQALRELPLDMPLILEYPKGVSESVFWVQGFLQERSLTWMSIDLGPRSAQSEVSPQPGQAEQDR
jgi:hypothetical protein